MTQQEYDNLVEALMSKESADRIMRERGLVVNGIPMNAELPAVDPSQAAVGQPQSQGSFAVPVAPTPPSSLSVRGPEDQSVYDRNAAMLEAFRRDPLSYISGMREKQLGSLEKRYAALTDPTSPEYRGRSQANWFNLAAQLMKPTMSGSLVENLGGAFGYLGSEAGRRQDMLAALQERRAELAQKYDIEMLRSMTDLREKEIAASKPTEPKSIVIGQDAIPRDPISGQPIEVPNPIAYKALEDNPTDENLQNFLVNFPRFKQEAVRAITRGRMRRGTM